MNKQELDFVLRAVGRYVRGKFGGLESRLKKLRDDVDGFSRCAADAELDRRPVAELLKRVSALEANPPAPGLKGDPGRDADPVTDERLANVVAGHLSRNPPAKGDPGRDAEPISDAAIAAAVDRYIKANPPAPGLKGDPGRDADPVTDERLANVVAGHLSRNPPAKGDPGRDAEPITDLQIGGAVERYLKAHPIPSGQKGDPGRDADPISDAAIAAAVDRYIKANPPRAGEKGDPGRDADPISLALVVRELLDSDELKSLVELRAKESAAALPRPKDGRDADPISDAAIAAAVDRYIKANPPRAGEKGDPGADGVGLAGFLIDREGILVATTSKGEAIRLGHVVGKDGLSIENVTREYISGTHEICERWTQAGAVKELRYPAGGLTPKGYWKEGVRAKACEAWTNDGALWIALKDTSDRPGITSTDWVIGARKGRDGKDGRNGRDGNPPPVKLDGA